MLLSAISVCIGGLVLLVLGIRGKPVGNSVDCAACGYDLRHMDRTPQSKCPECGKGVWTGAVVHTRRRRLRALVRSGAACMMLAMAFATLHVVQRHEMIDWYRWRSVTSLMDEVGSTNASQRHERAWKELSDRRRHHVLNDDDVGDIMTIALDRHVAMLLPSETVGSSGSTRALIDGRSQQPHAEHGRWIHAACVETLLPPAVCDAYLRRLFQPAANVVLMSNSVAGRGLTLQLTLKRSGIGGFETAEVVAEVDELLVDGQSMPLGDWSFVMPTEFTRDGQSPTQWRVNIPLNIDRGAHEVSLSIRLGLTQIVLGEGTNAATIGQALNGRVTWPNSLYETTSRTTHRIRVR